ncbi:MAG: AmmeMemoRadiSam system protein B [Candidatus Micrarchaeia archaeon]
MRFPAVAGSFYPANERQLRKMVEDALEFGRSKAKSSMKYYGGIVPHAGYIFSAKVAGVTFAALEERIKKAETAVLIGPNHYGLGSIISLSLEDWQTPLGVIKNNTELGKRIQEEGEYIDFDEEGHRREHSIEVQVPFLQSINPKIKIVPITMMEQGFDFAEDVGTALYRAVENENVVVIASTDLNHYVPAENAVVVDGIAIKGIETNDARKFIETVEKNELSVCGVGPVAALLIYSKLLDCKIKFLHYANSGEAKVPGYDVGSEGVVGYGSFVIETQGRSFD